MTTQDSVADSLKQLVDGIEAGNGALLQAWDSIQAVAVKERAVIQELFVLITNRIDSLERANGRLWFVVVAQAIVVSVYIYTH